MTDTDYMDCAEALLARVESCCDRINDETSADIDNQRVGGMVTLTFSGGSQIVVNLQKPLHEVWMDTKGNGEFFANLSRYASEQAGQALKFG